MATTRTPIEVRDRLTPALIAVPLGVLAAALAAVGAQFNPLLVLAAGGGLVVLAFAYKWPLLTLYLAVLCIPLEFAVGNVGGSFALSPSKVLLLATAAGWAASQVVNRRPLIVQSPLTLPLILSILMIVPGLLVAAEPLVVINQLAIWTAWFLIFQAVVQEGDQQFVRRLLVTLAFAGFALGLRAILDSNFQGQSASAGGTYVTGRADAGLSGPNALAALLITTSLAAVSQVLHGPPWRRALGAVAAGVAIAGLLLTQSRGGFLGVAAGLLIFISWRPMRRLAVAGLIVLAMLSFTAINPLGTFLSETAIGERIESITSGTAAKTDPRIPVYTATLKIIEDHPLFGVGTNDYQSAAKEYGIMTNATALTHAHNVPLTVAAERGLLGFAALLYFAFMLGRVLLKEFARATGEKRGLVVTLMAIFVGFATHSLVDYPFSYSVLLGELFVLAGCAVVLSRKEPETAP